MCMQHVHPVVVGRKVYFTYLIFIPYPFSENALATTLDGNSALIACLVLTTFTNFPAITAMAGLWRQGCKRKGTNSLLLLKCYSSLRSPAHV